jgi:hypothetical protein
MHLNLQPERLITSLMTSVLFLAEPEEIIFFVFPVFSLTTKIGRQFLLCALKINLIIFIFIVFYSFELAFPTCAELEYCAQAIKKAKLDAPNYVHLAKDAIFSLDDGTMPIREEADLDAKREEAEFHAKMEQWKNELTKLFGRLWESENYGR